MNETAAEKKRARDRRYYAKNKEAVLARQKLWYAENYSTIATTKRAYYLANRDELLEKQRADVEGRRRRSAQHYAKHGERVRARLQKWTAENPERIKKSQLERDRRRRARVRSATVVPFTLDQLEQRLSMYARCWICGDPRWTDVDHVKPLAKGGPHMLANLRPACEACNSRKSATWPFTTTISPTR